MCSIDFHINAQTPGFPVGIGPFQQDFVPCHTTRVVQEWFEEHDEEFKVLVCAWPSNSVNLNSIKHLWDVLEIQV